jgi:sugar phosphate isomerase/epimerase
LSQVVTLNTPLDRQLEAYARAGWTAIEFWLTKLETEVDALGLGAVRNLLKDHGLTPVAAAGQGGVLDPAAPARARDAHWDHFRRRLDLLAEIGVPTLILGTDLHSEPTAELMPQAVALLALAAREAGQRGVTLALEFQKSSRFGTNLETALAWVESTGMTGIGVCLDLFHFWCGPSKCADLKRLAPGRIAHVQVCDLLGTARELAADSDRLFPGEGEIPLGAILSEVQSTGYQGPLSIEVLNPRLWEFPADRIADLAWQSLARTLAALPSSLPGST